MEEGGDDWGCGTVLIVLALFWFLVVAIVMTLWLAR